MFEQIQQAIFTIFCGPWLLLHVPNNKNGKSSASNTDCCKIALGRTLLKLTTFTILNNNPVDHQSNAKHICCWKYNTTP